jgi:Ca-activated chloride channel family protein
MKMLSSKVKITLALFAVVCLAAQVESQSGRVRSRPTAPQDQDDKDTLKLRVEEILLPVSVRSGDGKLPPHLQRGDIVVLEDGKRQQVTSVMRTPANVLLILDSSGETNFRKDNNVNRDLALKIIDSLSEQDQAAIITYAERVSLICPWTADKQALRHALNWSFRPGIRSNFYDCIEYAAEQVLPKVSGRRSVVMLSDGVDSNGDRRFEEALVAIHHARATVYVASPNAFLLDELKPIAFNPLSWFEMIDPNNRKRLEPIRRYYRDLEAAEVRLKGFAEETGGAVWIPPTRDAFKTVSDKIISEIGTEYVVAYMSERPPRDTGFHPVKVYATRPELQIRTRRGVYSNIAAGSH